MHKTANPGEQTLIEQDVASLLYKHALGGLTVSFIASGAIALLPGPPPSLRAVWFGLMCLVLCVRAAGVVRWHQRHAVAEADGRLAIRHFGFGVVATGIVWSAFPLLFFSALDEGGRTAVAVIFAAMAGGSATVLAASKTLATFYSAALLLPASLMFVLVPARASLILGLLGGVYFLIMAASSRVNNHASMTAIALGRKNQALILHMEQERERTERANAELRKAEAALQQANLSLESRIQARTADLEELNQQLGEEVAERRAVQKALANREAHFRALIEHASDVMFVVSAAGVIDYVSPTVTRILGYEPAEMIGQDGFRFIAPDDVAHALSRLQATLSAGHRPAILGMQARHKNGSAVHVEAIGNNQIQNPAVRGIVITLRDVTDRRRLEEQFRQAQKMEAVGLLAGGVAHDFNNLLTVICGYSDLMKRRIPEGNALLGPVGQIQRAGDRATALVQQLLAFSRKQVVQPATLNLNEVVADLEKMLRRLIGEDIELTIDLCREPVYIHMDRSQFDQILMNLSVNARDAMPNGGALSISTAPRLAADTPDCANCKMSSGDLAVLTVRDTGTGMSEETRARVFEPFFTTKEVGKGTGLGLSMVYGAVEQADGRICLQTELGKGTTFRICLPRVGQAEPTLGDAGVRDNVGGNETILLVEDEEPVRALLSEALKSAGYHVLEACHGLDALDVVSHSNSAIDLAVTDVTMPKMSGRELAAHLATLCPETKVLFISGYPKQELASGCRFLKKPFTPDELIREVRTILDEVLAS